MVDRSGPRLGRNSGWWPRVIAAAGAVVLAGCTRSAPPAEQIAAAVPSAPQSSTAHPAKSAIVHPATQPTPRPPFEPSARECTSDSVRAEFRGGGYGGGNDFGLVWIWNPQPQPCSIRGQVAFAAYFASGSRDPAAVVNGTVSFPPTTLPAHMPAPGSTSDPTTYLVATFIGPERDDPAQPDGACRAGDELTPATLELTLGTVSVRVRNQAANSDVKAMYGCHGQVLLAGVAGPFGS
jgi:hypothetical protein